MTRGFQRSIGILLIGAAGFCLMSLGSAAAAESDRADCIGNANNPDQKIAACTRVIDDGAETTANRVIAFNNRGFGYSSNGTTTARSRSTTKRSSSIRNSPPPSATAALPMGPKATATARSQITTKRSSSIRGSSPPTTTAASPTPASRTTTAPSRTTARPSISIPNIFWPTRTAAMPTSTGRSSTAPLRTTAEALGINPKYALAYAGRGPDVVIQGRI